MKNSTLRFKVTFEYPTGYSGSSIFSNMDLVNKFINNFLWERNKNSKFNPLNVKIEDLITNEVIIKPLSQPGPFLRCILCHKKHQCIEKSDFNVWIIPSTITTSKNNKGFYFHCEKC